jgi:dienelactone hydrolase
MRWLLLLLPAMLLASSIPPDQDRRNTDTPDTDTHFSMREYKTVAEWEAHKTALRKQILAAAGLYPIPERGAVKAEVFGRIEHKDYSIEKVLVETLPGYYLGGNLYRPLGRGEKHPGILTPHGHWTYGRLENQPLYSGPALGISLARQGYVAFAYDMVGYNDTIQIPHRFGSPVEQLWSFGPLGLQLWNSIRALDFLISLEDVDAARIGVTGASGGGTQAFLLSAVDDRISYAAPVNMVSAIMQGGDYCENAPSLRVGTNNMEFAAMFAPKPMLLVSATGDWTRNVPHEEFPAIQRIYELYGKADNIEVVQMNAEHNFNQASREAVYSFFNRHILRKDERFVEKEPHVEMLQDMLALSDRTLKPGALTYEQVFAQWKELTAAPNDEIQRERLRLVLGTEWPSGVISSRNGEHVVLGRENAGDRVPGVLLEGTGPAALVVHPKGAAAARLDSSVAALRKSGRAVMLIDTFQTGSAAATRNRSHEHFLTFNRSDDACRVQDILTALAFLHQKYAGEIELIGIGDAAVWAAFAAPLSPVPVELHADLSGFRTTDQEYLSHFNVPGIRWAGVRMPAAAR